MYRNAVTRRSPKVLISRNRRLRAVGGGAAVGVGGGAAAGTHSDGSSRKILTSPKVGEENVVFETPGAPPGGAQRLVSLNRFERDVDKRILKGPRAPVVLGLLCGVL